VAIYYLDVDDEITTAAAHIRDCPDEAVALVLPGASRVATSRINFRLLAREAEQRQRRLTIVAPEAEVQSLARSAGLPVFATVSQYEAALAGRGVGAPAGSAAEVSEALGQLAATIETPGGRERRAVAFSLGRYRIGLSGAVSIGLASLLAAGALLGAYLFLPGTTITLTVREEPVGPLQMTLRVDPAIVKPDDAIPAVPGLTKRVALEQSDSFAATGQKVEETAATGTATFTNTNNFLDVPVLAGTRVWTADDIVFTTTAAITVPKATVNGTTITPGKADAPIAAAVKGTSGNVPAGAIVNVPDSLAAVLISEHPVTNADPTSGGTHTVNPLIVQADVDNARSTLSTRLTLQFAAALTAPDLAPAGIEVFRDTARVDLDAIVYDPDPATLVNQQQATFTLSAAADGTVTMADLAVVRSLAERKLQASVKTGYALVNGSADVEMGISSAEGAVVTVALSAAATQAPKVDADQLRKAVRGKSIDQARRYLSQFGKVEISSWPGLWTSDVAGYDFRIDIRIVLPTPHRSASPSSTASLVVGPLSSAGSEGSG
jgi:hypothetical protein